MIRIMKTEFSFFELDGLGIPTAVWEDYDASWQLQEGSEYLIGVLSPDDELKYAESKTLEDKESQLDYIKDIRRRYGSDSKVIIQEVPDYVETGTLVISSDGAEAAGEGLSDDDKLELSRWVDILSSKYLFQKDIVIIWGKDRSGELLVRSIH